MNKEFVPYEQALALKELGFDEPCFGLWNLNKGKHEIDIIGVCRYSIEFKYREVIAPLYQQAFRWFREKHRLHSNIGFDSWHTNEYMIEIVKEGDIGFHYDDPTLYKTYEEAELACLNKLIEIVKQKL
jgi:hypothetical protein